MSLLGKRSVWYALAANLVVLIHFGFIAFVALGALLLPRWPGLISIHLPAVVWGVTVSVMSWTCPLTPLENRLRVAGGGQGYAETFIEHYLTAVIYPEGLSRPAQVGLGLLLVLINVAGYARLFWRGH